MKRFMTWLTRKYILPILRDEMNNRDAVIISSRSRQADELLHIKPLTEGSTRVLQKGGKSLLKPISPPPSVYYEETEYHRYPTTADYAKGTCTIYSSPKRPKINAPVYAYKFVETNSSKPKLPARRKKRKCNT